MESTLSVGKCALHRSGVPGAGVGDLSVVREVLPCVCVPQGREFCVYVRVCGECARYLELARSSKLVVRDTDTNKLGHCRAIVTGSLEGSPFYQGYDSAVHGGTRPF